MSWSKYISALAFWITIPYIVGLLLLLAIFPQYYFITYPFVIIIFAGLGALFYKLLLQNSQMSQRSFYSRFMINMFAKIFISIILIVFYIVFIKQQIIAFVIVYVSFYMILSVFETITFIQLSKKVNYVEQKKL